MLSVHSRKKNGRLLATRKGTILVGKDISWENILYCINVNHLQILKRLENLQIIFFSILAKLPKKFFLLGGGDYDNSYSSVRWRNVNLKLQISVM